MATVQCPICGTTNPNGRRRAARCRRCRETLGKCRYCHHYDARLLDCVHPAHPMEDRIVDADAELNCLEFDSILVTAGPAPRRLLALLRTALIAVAATLAVMFGVIRLHGGLTRPLPPVLLRASVSTPPVSFQDSGLDVKVLVRNEADHPARDVEVRISGQSMLHLTCQYVRPSEAFLNATRRSVSALLGDLEPGEIGSVVFHFVAAQPGELDMTAHVTAANMEGPQKLSIEGEVVP